MTLPTIVDERSRRRDGGYALITLLLLVAVASPFLRDGPVDTGTKGAVAVLAVIALGMGALGVHLHRHPKSLIVADDEIRLEPGGPTQRIHGAGGTLRLRTIGSARYRQLVLNSTDRDGQIPLAHFRRDEVADACHRHGWTFGD